MPIPGTLEAAFNQDHSGDPESLTWTNITADTASNGVPIRRGRTGPGAATVDAGGFTVPLINSDGRYTPGKATSPYYPMAKGTLVRHYVNTGRRWASFDGVAGSRWTCPDSAPWALGATMAGAVQFRSPLRTPDVGFAYEFFGQTGSAGNRSWVLYLGSGGTAGLRFSSDGTAEVDAVTSLGLFRPDAGPLTLGWKWVGNNGAGGNTTTWYLVRGTVDDLLAAPDDYLFGDPYINSGTASLFNTTGTPSIGDVTGSGFAPFVGGIERVYLRSATLTSGTVVADVRFTAATVGASSFADNAGTPQTWTKAGGTAVTDRKITFTGELTANVGTYPGQAVAGTARRTWTVADILRRLRTGQPKLESALFRRIMAPLTDTTVHVYYPLEEKSGATLFYSPLDGIPPGVCAMSPASDSAYQASDALPSVSGNQPFGWSFGFPTVAPSTGWEYTMVARMPVAPVAGSGEFFDLQRIDTNGGTTTQWVIRIDDTNWRVFAKDETGTNVLAASGASDPRFFNDTLLITLSVAQSGGNITWDLDLIPESLGGTVFGGSGTLLTNTLGSPFGFRTLDDSAAQDGLTVGHFILTTGAVAGWLAPADTAYAGEPPGQRINRLLYEQGIPRLIDAPYNGIRSADWPAVKAAGAKGCGPQRPGLTLLEHVEEAARVGNGYLYGARELVGIAYREGSSLYNQPAGLTVSGETTSPVEQSDSDQDYVNDVTVSRVNGAEFHLEAGGVDTPSDGFRYQDSKALNVQSDLDLPSQASQWLHEATWKEERLNALPLELGKNGGSLIDTWCDRSLGDRTDVTSLPAAAAASSTSQLLDGWTLTPTGAGQWKIDGVTRAADPFLVAVRNDGDSARRDHGSSTLSAPFIAGTHTSMSVDIGTNGRAWTTAGGDFPFDLDVAGARVTVTAIGAPAGTVQTFTVSATIVNGVAKTCPTGTEVHVWRDAVRAL